MRRCGQGLAEREEVVDGAAENVERASGGAGEGVSEEEVSTREDLEGGEEN